MNKKLQFIDPHIHMTSRTTNDYEAMSDAGIVAIIEPSFWLGQPRTQVGSFQDYFSSLVGWEPFRASQFGIKHYCTIGLNSKEANNEELAEQVMELLPLYLHKENVVAVGEIGYDDQTKSEEKYFRKQLELAIEFEMLVQIHTPHRDKKSGTIKSMEICLEHQLDPSKVVIDHNNEETVKDVLDKGFVAAFSIYPHTKMGNERMAEIVKKYGSDNIIVDSSADWGVSDPLAVPKTASLMLQKGISEKDVKKTCYENSLKIFSKSGKMKEEHWKNVSGIDQTKLFNDNSVLRGQKPKVEVDKII